ncbi:MAG: glycosyltransferase [Deltaproteobacteria bacterium]|nr:glycosyltransferase [Deltaproteobacteria bacterium]MBW1792971.1 glycosyltransferase [Deltaproteobacteria bacterium]
MNTLIVIPSYWTKVAPMESQAMNQRSFDQQFGHKGPCLEKVLTSLKILKEKDFQVLVITGTDSPESHAEMNQKVMGIVEHVAEKTGIKILLFPNTLVARVRETFRDFCDQDALDFLCVDGYANIRNTGLIMAQILGAKEVVFVDDDEYVDDPLFLHKAREYLGKTVGGKIVAGVGGYYVDPQKAYRRIIKPEPWKAFWDLERLLNEALCRLVETQPRIKLTSMVLGGCLVLTRPLFAAIPFDVHIPRGEDMDYVINARMFRFSIFFDNQLYIVHDPPPPPHPLWKRLRQDIYRFIYERAKLSQQILMEDMDYVSIEELMPYPGGFLGKDLEDKISRACAMLAQQADDEKSAREFLNNVVLMGTDAVPQYNVFEHYVDLQSKWEKMCRTIAVTKELRQGCLALLPGFPLHST